MPGVVAPDRYPIRDPRDVKMNNGRTANPPRMIEVGGLDAQKKWDRGPDVTGSQEGNAFAFPIEGGGPTGVKMAHDAKDSDDD
jgi:hypothetical protein